MRRSILAFISIVLVLGFTACAKPAETKNETGIEIKKLADVSLIEENGIIYNPANKYDKNFKECYFDITGNEIEPDIETIYFSGENKGTEHSVPYSFELEVIRYGGGTVAKINTDGNCNEKGVMYSHVNAYSVDNDYALIQMDDNIYKADYSTRELTQFINGEYRGFYVDKIPVYKEDGSLEDYGYDSPCHARMEYLNIDDGYFLFRKRIEGDTYLYYKNLLSGDEHQIGVDYRFYSFHNGELMLEKWFYGEDYSTDDSSDYSIEYYKFNTKTKELDEITSITESISEIKSILKTNIGHNNVEITPDSIIITSENYGRYEIENDKSVSYSQFKSADFSPSNNTLIISGLMKQGDSMTSKSYVITNLTGNARVHDIYIDNEFLNMCNYITDNNVILTCSDESGLYTKSYILSIKGGVY